MANLPTLVKSPRSWATRFLNGTDTADAFPATANAKTLVTGGLGPIQSSAITSTSGTPGSFNLTAHNFLVNAPVVLLGSVPTNFTAGIPYYVMAANYAANTFTLSLTPGGAAINVGSSVASGMIIASGDGGSKVVSVMVANDDTVQHNMGLYLSDGTNSYLQTTVAIPASAGALGTVATVDFLAGGSSAWLAGLPRDNDGQKYIFVPPGWTLKVNNQTAFTTSARVLHVSGYGGDF